MDLVTLLFGLPLAPVRGLIALAEVLRQQAEQEMYDPAVARRELEEMGEERAAGEISADEEAEQQQEILDRLTGARPPDRSTEADQPKQTDGEG